jgi:hypothetical protein
MCKDLCVCRAHERIVRHHKITRNQSFVNLSPGTLDIFRGIRRLLLGSIEKTVRSFVRHIVVIALLVGYVAGAHATLLQLIDLNAVSSGEQAVKQMSGKAKEPRRPVWTQRRHLPLVHKLTLSPMEPPSPVVPEAALKFLSFPTAERLFRHASDYFSSRCNKAPPQA